MNSVSLYFCTHCPGWTVLQHGICRDCFRHLELSQSDPTQEELLAVMGDGLRSLGVLVVDRGVLPRICQVFSTSQGLLFSPQMKKMGQKYVLAHDRSLTCWLSSLRRGLSTPDDAGRGMGTDNAFELLYGTPGAFFLAFHSMTEVVWTARNCVIRTNYRKEVALKPQRRRDGVFGRLKEQLDGVLAART